MLQHRERSHLNAQTPKKHRQGLPASFKAGALSVELGVADGKAGREPLPGAARFSIISQFWAKVIFCYGVKFCAAPLTSPPVVYSKGNFILNKNVEADNTCWNAQKREPPPNFGVVQAVLQAGSTVTTAECEGEPSPG